MAAAFPLSSPLCLLEENQLLRRDVEARLQEQKAFSPPPNPKDYFHPSSFWDYTDKYAMYDWGYCLSRFRQKEEIISHVFLGRIGALMQELARGDYSIMPDRTLVYKGVGAQKQWQAIKEQKLGKQAPVVAFTRVISIVGSAAEAARLKAELEPLKDRAGYKCVIEHEYIELPDLPAESREEECAQRQKWDALVKSFPRIFAMIDRARVKREDLLIHCVEGRHRSAALLTAYLADRLSVSIFQATNYVQEQRNCALFYKDSLFTPLLEEWKKMARAV